ncbi:O-antigen ligase domain-containing protein [Enterococcus plantarum]|uniref:O-antigen ligase domain-containing protein n=1 Tax=Enterococcus plantarum TaxID=1077675 RepID=A0A2W3YRQ9_9ENTE|nr:O-antigen ligase family protein [Enterococcus plantarum]PZL70281.1 O-antigen ligase domain-containing protein [Enterococcus plantarum]
MIKKANEILDKVEIPFILVWEFMLILRMISTYSLIPSKFDSIIFTIISLVGGLLLIRNGVDWFQKRQRPSVLLLLFTLVLIVTSVINRQTGLTANFKLIIWQVLLFFVVYEIGKKNQKKLFKLVEKILVFTWLVLVIISLGMFFVQFKYTAPLDKLYYGIRMGFVENRLYGVFVDPNYAATISVVAICFSLHLFTEAKVKLYKGLLIVSVILEFLFVVLSGSRTATIEIMAITVVWVFFYFYYNKKSTALIQRLIYSAVVSLIAVVALFLLMDVTQKVSVVSAEAVSKVIVIKNVEKDNISLDRPDTGEDADISNSRFKLWNSAFEIFETKPLVGTSPKGMIPYAKKHLSNTWISIKEQTPHNFMFYLLATTGLLGTIPFMIFILYNVFKSLRTLFKMNTRNYTEYLFQSLIVLTILISACLITDIVLVNRLGAMMFFLYIGRLNSKNEKETSEIEL